MVEEEIPPSWQVEENAAAANEITTEVAGKEEEEEQPQQFANRLTEEHLQLLFEIRQKQDDQMHSQSILGQRMDILFDALADAPACAPDAQHAANGSPRSTQFMDNQARQWSEVSRLWFFVNSSCRINGLVYHSSRIEEHTVFSYTVYVVLLIAALSIVGLRDHPEYCTHFFVYADRMQNFV
jgi:hypothetical protein